MGELTLGEKLLLFRKRHKIRQQDLAKLIGITKTALSQMEANHYQPRFDTLSRLCDQFDISLAIFQNTSEFLKYINTIEKPAEPSQSEHAEAVISNHELSRKW